MGWEGGSGFPLLSFSLVPFFFPFVFLLFFFSTGGACSTPFPLFFLTPTIFFYYTFFNFPSSCAPPLSQQRMPPHNFFFVLLQFTVHFPSHTLSEDSIWFFDGGDFQGREREREREEFIFKKKEKEKKEKKQRSLAARVLRAPPEAPFPTLKYIKNSFQRGLYRCSRIFSLET